MPPTVLTGIVTKAGVMAKTVTMTVRKVKTHPKLLKVRIARTGGAWRLTEGRRTCAIKSTSCTTLSRS